MTRSRDYTRRKSINSLPCVSVDSGGHVLAGMNRDTSTQFGMRRKRAAPLMNLSVRLVGLKKAPRITISLGAYKYLKIFSICKYE